MQQVQKENYIYAFSKDNKPAVTVNDGEAVTLETYDCFTGQILDESTPFSGLNWDKINPATGPVYIKGACVGDILAVHIQKINLATTGLLVSGEGLGVAGNVLKGVCIKKVQIKDNYVIFSDQLSFPTNPMIGVIGVAPADGSVSCGTPDAHGGNMDCKKIAEGATIYFKVNVDGALFGLGDLHAAMGDGEIGVSGVEIAGTVSVSFNVIKDISLPTPFLENDKKIMVIASKPTLEEAVESVTIATIELLAEQTTLSKEEASCFLSAKGDLKICQVVDPNKTVRMEIEKSLLQQIGFQL